MPPRKKKDPNAPKKGLTDFMLFQQDMRAEVKKEHPEATFGEIGKILGEKWKNISQAEKLKYQERSQKDKERYRAEKEKYDKDRADDDSPSDDNEKPTKKRAKKDPNKPKGSLSAYMFYNREVRPTVSSSHPDATFGDVGKLIGQQWKDLQPAQKKKFDDLAAKDKKRYEADMAAYKSGSAPPAATKNDKGDDDDDDDDTDATAAATAASASASTSQYEHNMQTTRSYLNTTPAPDTHQRGMCFL
eukprot:c12394_g1_i3.p1 GENE.c12394_g1_i3~~c12394_g1_i3.p1  ORF type:complete len:245 (+),score=70.60 c12394_g1_i3:222-956(+)